MSILSYSCFRIPVVLASTGNQNMKSRSKSGNSLRHPVRRPRIRVVRCAVHGTRSANHAQPLAGHASLARRHRPNQSLAKHNRKPRQAIENKRPQPKSIAGFCRLFLDYGALFQPPQNRRRRTLLTNHQSLIAPLQTTPGPPTLTSLTPRLTTV